MLSHPASCVDTAGWTFLLFGSTVAICVVSGAEDLALVCVFSVQLEVWISSPPTFIFFFIIIYCSIIPFPPLFSIQKTTLSSMVVDVLLLVFQRWLYARWERGNADWRKWRAFFAYPLFGIDIFTYFYIFICRHPLLLSHPATCVDMAGWTFLLFGSTVAICVVSSAEDLALVFVFSVQLEDWISITLILI